MESIIKDFIQKHLQANDVIPPEQHGITPAQLNFYWLSMNGQKHLIMVTL